MEGNLIVYLHIHFTYVDCNYNIKVIVYRIDNIQIFDKDPNALMTASSVVVDDGLH